MVEQTKESFGRLGAQRRAQRRSGLWFNAYHRLAKNKLSVVCTVLVLFLLFMSIFANFIAPYPYDEAHFKDPYIFPFKDARYILGTDSLGRDELSRLIYGGRVSLFVGIGAQLLALLIGLPLGLLAGLRGGKTDYVIGRAVDVFSSLPYLVTVILLVALLGPGLVNIFLAIGISAWVEPCRLIRGQVLSVKKSLPVRAAVSMGAGQGHIMRNHLLPNSIPPIIVATSLGIPAMIFAEAGLSFLGLGVRPPTPSWGLTVGESFQYARGYYYLALFPALMVAFTMLGFTLMGDGLRDALDPRMSD